MSDLASHIEGVAKELLGDPNPRLSKPGRELRYGSGGSVAVDLRKGTVFDHEQNAGGGVLWLIETRTGLKGRQAFEWLSERGFRVDDLADTRPVNGGSKRYSAPTPINGHGNGSARPEQKPSNPVAKSDKPSGPKPKQELVDTYDYTDVNGTLLYQVLRYEWDEDGKRKKTFKQRRPFKGAWAWSITAGTFRQGQNGDWYKLKGDEPEQPTDYVFKEDVPHGLYRIVELHEALADEAAVFLPEGEKDVETLVALGIPATTNSGGAQHWGASHAAAFKDADVVLMLDNDEAGRKRADLVARSLHGIARRVRVLDVAAFWAECPAKGDVSDWVKAKGITADDLYEVAATLPAWKPPEDAFQTALGVVLWQDLDKAKDPIEYLIKGWLTAGEVSILAGPSGSGKSFVTLDMAMAVARGEPFLGRYRVSQGGVLYQAGEGAKGLRDKRIKAYKQKHGLTRDDPVPFALLPRPIDLFGSDADTEFLIMDIRAAEKAMGHKIKLVVIDTASAATPGADENSAKDVSPVLQRCNRIAAECRAHVMLVAHMNAEAKKVRGHTSWQANVDTVMVCRVLEELRDAARRPIREIEITKQKDGEQGNKTRFTLPAITIGVDPDGDEIRSCTIEEPDEGEIQGIDTATPADGRGLSDQAFGFIKALETAIAEHGVEATGVGVALPYGMKVVEFATFRELFAKTSFESGDAKDAAIRQAIKRHGQKLFNMGLVGRRDPYIWRTGKPLSGRDDVTPPAVPVTPGPPTDDIEWGNL